MRPLVWISRVSALRSAYVRHSVRTMVCRRANEQLPATRVKGQVSWRRFRSIFRITLQNHAQASLSGVTRLKVSYLLVLARPQKHFLSNMARGTTCSRLRYRRHQRALRSSNCPGSLAMSGTECCPQEISYRFHSPTLITDAWTGCLPSGILTVTTSPCTVNKADVSAPDEVSMMTAFSLSADAQVLIRLAPRLSVQSTLIEILPQRLRENNDVTRDAFTSVTMYMWEPSSPSWMMISLSSKRSSFSASHSFRRPYGSTASATVG